MPAPGQNRRKKSLLKNHVPKGRSEVTAITKTLTATQKRQRITNPKSNVTFSKKKLRQKNKKRDQKEVALANGDGMVDAEVVADEKISKVQLPVARKGTVLGAPSA
ncbi:hypothetical protein SARC_10642 [Sphaeroforma arctica JP610]|uniref:Uncharacterized protein n=1 Tax=Sphaeroforma arctica JP610 TaxID=667725 RepID=A0A0L0FK75_9EUKA|nr:hypothetical protein SARC_10642 [Sphaeroforma arctica JP610]KNC76881.1 hypothetical protein SARC_10642 [Sphaeroforma arctica JP610]|eukprot:XP_014150783.1 hypothetical protein SARC_10642 [Sphaeroforma arctica JP610]